ncbi:MAG: hypothetical protein ABR915_04325, partial [Thermoguttaceae bacterium]
QTGKWTEIMPAQIGDQKGKSGAATKTSVVEAGGRKFYVMTLQKGAPPEVQAEDNAVKVGKLSIRFDGEKLILGP